MICENIECGVKILTRSILIPTAQIRVCESCYRYHRRWGQMRKIRLCHNCQEELRYASKVDFCSTCWQSQCCVVEDCQNSKIKHSTSGLCAGHKSQQVRGEQLRPLNIGVVFRAGLDDCPVHEIRHYKTPSGNNRCASCDRERRWTREYGLTEREVFGILDMQHGLCGFQSCERVMDLDKINSYHIDHCHETGTVRGILCPPHNQLLGMAKDRVDILTSAIEYLKKDK